MKNHPDVPTRPDPRGSPPTAVTLSPSSLRPFSLGPEVVHLQILLRAAGYDLEPDGRFGPMTRECVKSFQAAHGLKGSGTVEPLTWDALEGGGALAG